MSAPVPVHITFPAFTSNEVLFANKDAANAFFASITVPLAGGGSGGVIGQADAITTAYTPPSYDSNSYVTIGYTDPTTGLPATIEVVTKAAFLMAIQNIQENHDRQLELITKLVASLAVASPAPTT